MHQAGCQEPTLQDEFECSLDEVLAEICAEQGHPCFVNEVCGPVSGVQPTDAQVQLAPDGISFDAKVNASQELKSAARNLL